MQMYKKESRIGTKGEKILRNICILLSFTTLAISCDKYPTSPHEQKNDFPGLSSPLFPSLFSYNKWLKTTKHSAVRHLFRNFAPSKLMRKNTVIILLMAAVALAAAQWVMPLTLGASYSLSAGSGQDTTLHNALPVEGPTPQPTPSPSLQTPWSWTVSKEPSGPSTSISTIRSVPTAS